VVSSFFFSWEAIATFLYFFYWVLVHRCTDIVGVKCLWVVVAESIENLSLLGYVGFGQTWNQKWLWVELLGRV
jgi:hypothetical protein